MLPPVEMLSQVDIQSDFNIFRQELRDKYPIKSALRNGELIFCYKDDRSDCLIYL